MQRWLSSRLLSWPSLILRGPCALVVERGAAAAGANILSLLLPTHTRKQRCHDGLASHNSSVAEWSIRPSPQDKFHCYWFYQKCWVRTMSSSAMDQRGGGLSPKADNPSVGSRDNDEARSEAQHGESTPTEIGPNRNGTNGDATKRQKKRKKGNNWITRDNDTTNNKRKNRGQQRPGREGGRNDSSRGPNAERQKNIRRGDNDWEAESPHAGSYACPSMQRLFGVAVASNIVNTTDTTLPSLGEGKEDGKGGVTGSDESPSVANDTAADEQPQSSVATEGTADTASGGEEAATFKYPKRKVALLVAFVGSRYGGMQINVDQRTIQAELELALYKAGCINESNFGFPHKYSWSNSARTDRGVHSCAQVCSLKVNMINGESNTDAIREKINAALPDDIRILDVVRVTRSFCARTQRDKVRYQYMIPSFLFYPREHARKLFEKAGCPDNGRHPSDPLSAKEVASVRPTLIKYRASREDLTRLREALSMFEGTHSFHNFTSGKTSADPSCARYILSFQAFDPVVAVDGTEWIPTQVVGQSFLLNQIRKMVSVAIDVARGATTRSTVADSVSKQNEIRINVAPAQGLFLDMSFFERYNHRQKDNDDLDWVEKTSAPAVRRWKDFKEQKVMRQIMDEEANDGNFVKYLFLQEYRFEHSDYAPISTGREDVDAEGNVSGKMQQDQNTTESTSSYFGRISDAAEPFLTAVARRCKDEHRIDVSRLVCDHICWRCETLEEYKRVCNDMVQDGRAVRLIESMIGGRPISTFRLKVPLKTSLGFEVECVEVPCPKPGSDYVSGLEHAEFVVGEESASVHGIEDLKKFRTSHVAVPFDEKGLGKKINPDISLSLGQHDGRQISCKFHQRRLSEVVSYELSQGKHASVPEDYFDEVKN